MRFNNLEGNLERENSKRTIFSSGGLGLLQMVSEPNKCASEDAEPPQGWIRRSHVGWRGKWSIPCKGVETSL